MTKSSKKSGKNGIENAPPSGDVQSVDSTSIDLENQIVNDLGFLVNKVFDATDDFLFSSSTLRSEESALNNLRELRNKKLIFLNRLSNAVIKKLKADWIEPAISESNLDSSSKPSTNSTSSAGSKKQNGSLFDYIEIDIFNENVIRRAMDAYAPMFEHDDLVKAGFAKLSEENARNIHKRFFCIVIDAMNDAREVLSLTQETTLVFLKQFEQYAILDMAQFFSTANSFVNHCLLPEAEDQYQLAFIPEEFELSESKDLSEVNVSDQLFSRRLSDAVEVTIVKLCDSENLPPYLVDMLNTQWRDVLLLVGSIRGHDSSEWNAVVKVATDLVAFATCQNTATTATTELFNMLKGGFNLIQLSESEQKRILRNLEQQAEGVFEEIRELPESSSQVETILLPQKDSSDSTEGENSDAKASISEAGRKILDDDDLDDIVALLSGNQEQTKEHVQYKNDGSRSAEDSLTSFLQMVDQLKEGDEVEFVREDEVQKCRIQTPAEKGNSYQVTNNSGQVVLARSRVGLALATKSGELRLGSLATSRPHNVSEPPTLIDANTDIEKTAAH